MSVTFDELNVGEFFHLTQGPAIHRKMHVDCSLNTDTGTHWYVAPTNPVVRLSVGESK